MAKYFAILFIALFGGEICTAQITFAKTPSKTPVASKSPIAGAGSISGVGAGVGASKVSGVAGAAKKPTAQDSKDPQARFFPGFGGGNVGFGGGNVGFGGASGSGVFGGGSGAGIFNPCSRCNIRDVRQANECCMKGEIQCCRFVNSAGFGSNLARPSAFRPGLTNPALHGQGFGSAGFPQGQAFGGRPTGFGSTPGFIPGSQGFVPGSQGFIPGSQSFVGGSQGFVPGSQGFVPGSQGFVPGSQGFIPGSQGFIPGSQGFRPGARPIAGRPHSNQKFGFCPKPNFIAEALGLRKVDDKKPAVRTAGAAEKSKVKRQAPAGKEKASDPKTRGLLNPFCRDHCFTDFDCPGNLKCCINSQDCRFCTNPVHF